MKELFVHAGWVAWPLGFFSVLALGVILERLFTLFWLGQQEDRAFIALQMALEQAHKRGEAPDETVLRNPQVASAPVTQVLLTIQPLQGAHLFGV